MGDPTAFITAWAIGMACGAGPFAVAWWSQRAGLTPEPPGGFVEDMAAGCAACGGSPAGRCARCSSNDPCECSDTTVGRRMWHLTNEPPELLITEVVRATLLSVGNWG